MKVHVLWYDYYEDSDIIGIYTDEGKRKKIIELQQEAIQYCKKYSEEYEKTLLKKKEERTIQFSKVTQAIEACKVYPKNKGFKQLKRSLIKEDEHLLKDIHYLQRKVEEYSLPEKALEVYMHDKYLTWFEREIIE